MTDSIEIDDVPQTGPSIKEFWYEALGIVQGEQVVILTAGTKGEGFQGLLVDVIFDGQTVQPLVISIQQEVGFPKVNVRWDAIAMITVPVTADQAASQPKPVVQDLDVPIEELIAFAKEQGITVPDDIQSLVDGDAS